MQMYEFPIASLFDNFKNKCLVDAMSCTSLPLLQVGLNAILATGLVRWCL